MTAHLAACEACRRAAERVWLDDQRLGEALQNVEIPAGLLDRLMESVATFEKVSLDPPLTVQVALKPLPSRRYWLSAVVTACLLLLAVGGVVWWNLTPQGPEMIPFATALEALKKDFGRQQEALAHWEQLPVWDRSDDSLKLEALDTLARKLNRFDPRKVDLDGQPGHEAVAFKFKAGKASGILVVLPGRFTSPAPADPWSPSQPFLAWSSPDGEQSYICFVHTGRAEDLLSLMMSV